MAGALTPPLQDIRDCLRRATTERLLSKIPPLLVHQAWEHFSHTHSVAASWRTLAQERPDSSWAAIMADLFTALETAEIALAQAPPRRRGRPPGRAATKEPPIG